jgi:hypothetical protein
MTVPALDVQHEEQPAQFFLERAHVLERAQSLALEETMSLGEAISLGEQQQ